MKKLKNVLTPIKLIIIIVILMIFVILILSGVFTVISDKIHTLSLLAEELLNEWEQCSERLDELQSGEE